MNSVSILARRSRKTQTSSQHRLSMLLIQEQGELLPLQSWFMPSTETYRTRLQHSNVDQYEQNNELVRSSNV